MSAGVLYVSDQVGILSNQNFVFPSYTVLDAALSYQQNRFQVQVNAYNLANKHYFTGSRSGVTLAGLAYSAIWHDHQSADLVTANM